MTIPAQLADRIRRTPDRAAWWRHDGGRWRASTWQQVGARVEALALGLCALDLPMWSTVAILGGPRAEWPLCEWAAHSVGAAVLGLSPGAQDDRIRRALQDAEVRVAFAETPELAGRLLAMRGACPSLDRIIVWDAEALDDDHAVLARLVTVTHTGYEGIAHGQADAVVQRAAAVEPGQTALRDVDGGILTQRRALEDAAARDPDADAAAGDVTLVACGLHAIGAQVATLSAALVHGLTLGWPRGGRQLSDDLARLRPAVAVADAAGIEALSGVAALALEARGTSPMTEAMVRRDATRLLGGRMRALHLVGVDAHAASDLEPLGVRIVPAADR